VASFAPLVTSAEAVPTWFASVQSPSVEFGVESGPKSVKLIVPVASLVPPESVAWSVRSTEGI